jgi:pyridoxine 4-dehydrogenase
MTDQDSRPNAAAASTFPLGGDLVVNRLGFGAMRLTEKGMWGEPDDPEEARRVLRRAVELGVNLIDTADSYGSEVSERLIAEALHPYRDDLVIATKGGLTRPGGRWAPDGRPEHLRKACEGSLKRLRVEHIDLYQLHRPDPRIAFEDSVWALAVLRDEGKISHVGLSNVGVRELEIALDIVPVASVQNRYNLSDRSSEAVLQACEREEVRFIP